MSSARKNIFQKNQKKLEKFAMNFSNQYPRWRELNYMQVHPKSCDLHYAGGFALARITVSNLLQFHDESPDRIT